MDAADKCTGCGCIRFISWSAEIMAEITTFRESRNIRYRIQYVSVFRALTKAIRLHRFVLAAATAAVQEYSSTRQDTLDWNAVAWGMAKTPGGREHTFIANSCITPDGAICQQ